MSIEKAKQYLKQFDMQDRVLELPASSATVELAAEALGCTPGHIAKTLSFEVNGRPVLVVAAGDARIHNGKFKRSLGAKPRMIKAEDVEAMVGHAPGGVCPFGVNEGVDVYLDQSLQAYDFVYPACGSGNSAIKLTIPELEKVTPFIQWVDVCKDLEN